MTGNLSLKFFSCPTPSKKQGKLVNIEDAWPALHAEILCYARLPLHKYSQVGILYFNYSISKKISKVNVGPTYNISSTKYLVGLMKDVM